MPRDRDRQSERTGRSGDPLAALAKLLLGSSKKSAPVLVARDAPEDYVRDHARELKQRGVSSARAVAPETLVWIALVDAMRRDRRAAEIDWRSPPDEVSSELEALRSAIPRAAWRTVAPAIADQVATEDFLRALARAVTDADPGMVLATLDKAADTAVVVPMKAAELPQAAKLIRAAGIGTISDVARIRPAKPKKASAARRRAGAADSTRTGGWGGFLASRKAANTHGIVLAAGRDPAVAQELADRVEEAPKNDRPALRAFLTLLREDGDRVAAEDPLLALEALRFLSFAPGYERRCFERTCDVLRNVERGGGIRVARAAVAAVRFALRPTEAGSVFRTLGPDCQRALRDVVHQSLRSKDAPTLVAALDAARVVGDAATARLVDELTGHPLPIVVTHARQAARSLRAR